MPEKLSGSHVFVTGATCPLGVTVCRLLVERGASVEAVVRDAEKGTLLPGAANWEVADCARPQTYQEALHRCTHVVHIAGMHLATAVIRACAGHPGLKRILFISSTRVHYPDRLLSRSERRNKEVLRAEEDAVTSSTLPWTILRPTLIHAPDDRSVSRIIDQISRRGVFFVPGSGRAVRQPLYAEDLAASVLKALCSENTRHREYDVPGRDITLREMAVEIGSALDRRVTFIRVPRLAVRLAHATASVLRRERYAAVLQSYLRGYEDLRFSARAAEEDFAHAPAAFPASIRKHLGAAAGPHASKPPLRKSAGARRNGG